MQMHSNRWPHSNECMSAPYDASNLIMITTSIIDYSISTSYYYYSYTHADIRDLAGVFQELTSNQQFNYTDWYQLGLYLGLYEPTLKAIEQDCRGKVKECLMECISAWLKEEDNVKKTGGGPSWLSLVSALETMGEDQIANNIKMKYCNY